MTNKMCMTTADCRDKTSADVAYMYKTQGKYVVYWKSTQIIGSLSYLESSIQVGFTVSNGDNWDRAANEEPSSWLWQPTPAFTSSGWSWRALRPPSSRLPFPLCSSSSTSPRPSSSPPPSPSHLRRPCPGPPSRQWASPPPRAK